MLNPKKAKSLYPAVASDHSVSVELTEDIVTFYWKEIKKAVVAGKCPNIIVEGIGTFKSKSWKIADSIRKYENIINKYQSMITDTKRISFQKFAILKENQERLAILLELQKLNEQEALKKQTIKNKKNGSTEESMA